MEALPFMYTGLQSRKKCLPTVSHLMAEDEWEREWPQNFSFK